MPEHSSSTSTNNNSPSGAEGLLGELAQFDSLLEGAPLGIGIFDRDLRHVRVNAVLEQMNGQSAHLLLGRTPSEVNGEVGRQAEVFYRQVMDSGSAMRDVRLSGEVSARPGQLRHWSTTFHPVRREGQVVGLCVIVDDVTAEHELSEALAASQRAHQRLAEDLQRDLLPPAHPTVPGADVAAIYHPASAAAAVGGDFYDVIAIDDDRWLLVIGDVQGKGPLAASLSGALRYAVRTAAVIDPDPAQVLATVNDVLVRLDDERTCTAVCLLLQRQQQQQQQQQQQAAPGSSWSLRTVSAGHPLPLLVRRDDDGAPVRVEALGVPNLLLGAVAGVRYQASTATLVPGESLVLYTDGVTEARAPRHQEHPEHPEQSENAASDSASGADPIEASDADPIELFGDTRLQALLSVAIAPPKAGAASELAEAVHSAVETFAGGSSSDDLTLLILHLPAQP